MLFSLELRWVYYSYIFIFIPFDKRRWSFFKHNLFVTSSRFIMYFDFMVSWYISQKTSFDWCGILSSEFLEWNYQIPTEACWRKKAVYEVLVRSCRCCIVKTQRSLWRTNTPEVEQSHLKLRTQKSGHSIPGLFSAMGSKALFARRPKVPSDEITPG